MKGTLVISEEKLTKLLKKQFNFEDSRLEFVQCSNSANDVLTKTNSRDIVNFHFTITDYAEEQQRQGR